MSPNGSKDAFYIKIDKHYGSSDHVTYMQHGIPAVMFITWPDMWYHSSQDTPDKQDPTQYKRAAVVGIGALAVLATGGDEMAARVTAENLARGTERIGEAQRKATSYLADARDAAALSAAYREGWLAVKHQAAVEKQVIRSSKVLYVDPAAAEKKLAPLEAPSTRWRRPCTTRRERCMLSRPDACRAPQLRRVIPPSATPSGLPRARLWNQPRQRAAGAPAAAVAVEVVAAVRRRPTCARPPRCPRGPPAPSPRPGRGS